MKCCKEHKIKYKCEGKKKINAFISKTNFSLKDLKKDMDYLGNMINKTDGIKKKMSFLKKKNTESLRLRLLKLYSKKNNNVDLIILPSIFEKHRENLSFYFTKLKEIYWLLEFKFFSFEEFNIILDKPVSENSSFIKILTENDFFNKKLLLEKEINLDKENMEKLIKTNEIHLFIQNSYICDFNEEEKKNQELYERNFFNKIDKKYSMVKINLEDKLCNYIKFMKITEYPTIWIVFNEKTSQFREKYSFFEQM